MPELSNEHLHEIRVNAILKAFVQQRDNAFAQLASVSAEKAVLEAQLAQSQEGQKQLETRIIEMQQQVLALTQNVASVSEQRDALAAEAAKQELIRQEEEQELIRQEDNVVPKKPEMPVGQNSGKVAAPNADVRAK